MTCFPHKYRPLIKITSLVLQLLLLRIILPAQTAGFIAPDTVCTGESIILSNTTTGGSTFYWSFCSGNANQNPTGVNIGNPGSLLSIPTYLTLVKQGNDCFSFISCQGVGVVRYYHGGSFKNDPLSWTNLGTFGGTITFSEEGIQVKEDNGQWYGIVCSDTKLVRLNFGTSLWNTPTATSLNFTGLTMLHGLEVIKEGTTWLGFATCSTGNTMVRFNFGTSLANTPVMTNFGNFAGFVSPAALCLVQENSLWYGLVMAGNNTLSRITFGTSLLNTPTGVNLGNPGGFNSAGGLTLLRDCESTTGYFVNYVSPGQLGKLSFPTGILGSVTGQVLGNIGNLDKPHSFSELFRLNDTLYAYITNRQTGTLTRLTFPPCTNASVPSSNLFNPPAFSYNVAGTFNVRLIVNEGLPTQSTVCKSIVVKAAPCNIYADFTAPDTVCVGESITLANQSTTGQTYYWSFCSGSASLNPQGTNIGNPGNVMNIPGYSTLVKDGNTCYSFVTCQGNKSVIRYNHGTSFSNNPISWTNLGGFNMLGDTVLGLKICQDNGQWIGIINNNNRFMRLNFGTSLANFPTATQLGPFPLLNTAHCIDIFKEGTTWIGYVTCSWGNKLVQLNFGNSLLNTPTLTNMGTPGSMNMPAAFRFVKENGIWYCLVANYGDNTLTRLTFGTSLFNAPTGVNLGNPCPGINAGGLCLIRDCETTTGFEMNYSSTSPNLMWRLTFPTGITGSVTGTSLGNIGSLSRPSQFSELFRVGDTLFVYNTNRDNYTLTRHRFLPCTNASVPSSTLYNPPSFSYNQAGTYNVQLIVNEGLATQVSVCKSIVVKAAPCSITAAFTAPDTVCTGEPVSITNQSTAGASYYWSFCSGNSLSNPTGTNIGNPGNILNVPVYITLAKSGNTCYSFSTNKGIPGVVRYNHGSSFSNNPVSWTNLGNFGTISDSVLGIKMSQDNGQWICFVNNNNRIIRLNFGSSPGNSPTATIIGPNSLLAPHCIDIFQEGSTWLGFVTSTSLNKFVRLNFGNSLLNNPTFTDLGNPGGLNAPVSFRIINENGIWYGLVCNSGNNTMTRLSFGNSLQNTPTGVNLGVICPSINPGGIALIRDCEGTTGFQLNYSQTSSDLIWRLNFPSGITGPVTGTSLGNIGALSLPAHFSELFRVGDTLFLYATNRQNSTLTRFRFLPCTNASVPSSTLYNPPSFSYNQAGNYNVQLIVNEGLATQQSICVPIVAVAQPVVSLGSDRSICPGTTTTLDAGAGFNSYLWSTGATTRMITVGTSGSYWVKITNYNCFDYDTVAVSLYPVTPVNLGPDQTICEGTSTTFSAGSCTGCTYVWSNLSTGQPNIGTGPTYTTGTPGVYAVTVTNLQGCISRDTIQLATNPTPVLNPLPVTEPICSGGQVDLSLSSNYALAGFYWSVTPSSPSVTGCIPGSGNTISQMVYNSSATFQTVTYHITPYVGSCTGTTVDYTITVKPVPVVTATPFAQSVCNGSGVTINLSSTIPSTTISWTVSVSSPLLSGYSPGAGWTISQVLYNAATTTETATYQIISVASGCQGETITYPVPVIPAPDFTINPVSQTICSGNPAQISFTGTAPTTQFSWNAVLSSGNISGFSAGNGNSVSQVLTNNQFTPGSVRYTVTAENSGCFSQPVSSEVMVNPSPSITNTSTSSAICSGSFTGIALNSDVAGTIFSWVASGSSPDISGFGPGQNDTINQQLFNYGFSEPFVTYTVVPNALGCNGAPVGFNVTVHPVPDVLFTPASTTICTGQQINIQLNSHVGGTTYSWDASGSSNYVSNFNSGNGSPIQQSPLNSGPAPESVTYTVTPVANGCPGAAIPYPATINPSPLTTISSYPGSLCSGENFGLSFSSATAGTIFSWNATATSPAVSGYSSSSGSSFSHTLGNAGMAVETVTYVITPQANGCTGSTNSVQVQVKPVPDIHFDPSSQSICNSAKAIITLSSSFTAAQCGWSASGSSSAVTGFSNGIGNLISQDLFNNGTGTETVTYSVFSSLNGCTGAAIQAHVMVYPVPDVVVTPAGQTICSGSETNLALQSLVAGALFQWTASGSSTVFGFANGSGSPIKQVLVNSSNTTGNVQYMITPSIANCTGQPIAATVTVQPNPTVSLVICNDSVTTFSAKPFVLRGGWPSGGSYSGAGITGATGVFNPALAGTGRHQVKYSYNNVYGCPGSSTGKIRVLPDPAFTCNGLLTDLRDGIQYPTYKLPNGKCWMASNLVFGEMVTTFTYQADNCIPEKFCLHDSLTRCITDGGFYQWNELMAYEPLPGSKGICPPAWHVPSTDEWIEMLAFNSEASQAAGPLLDHWLLNGFHAKPSGFDYQDFYWAMDGWPVSGTFYWTSTFPDPWHAYARGLNSINPSVSLYSSSRANAFPVRCVKD